MYFDSVVNASPSNAFPLCVWRGQPTPLPMPPHHRPRRHPRRWPPIRPPAVAFPRSIPSGPARSSGNLIAMGSLLGTFGRTNWMIVREGWSQVRPPKPPFPPSTICRAPCRGQCAARPRHPAVDDPALGCFVCRTSEWLAAGMHVPCKDVLLSKFCFVQTCFYHCREYSFFCFLFFFVVSSLVQFPSSQRNSSETAANVPVFFLRPAPNDHPPENLWPVIDTAQKVLTWETAIPSLCRHHCHLPAMLLLHVLSLMCHYNIFLATQIMSHIFFSHFSDSLFETTSIYAAIQLSPWPGK